MTVCGPPEHASSRWLAGPYLHAEADGIYDPLGDRRMDRTDERHAALRALLERRGCEVDVSRARHARLAADGWLTRDGPEVDRRSRLRFVSLETHSVCNQACAFCPVSIAPRSRERMPTSLFDRIVADLACSRATIEAVFLNNYNEPTLDVRFLEQVRGLLAAGLPPAVLTNGTGLTPERCRSLVQMGGLRFVSVNLSTLDRERYRRERGRDHLDGVLANLDFAAELRIAERMEIAVLGPGDARHRRDFESIAERFAGTRFAVRSFELMDRAGRMPGGRRPATPHRALRGCENLGSRPLQHLHVTASGRCVFCCEDYDERHVVGDLRSQSVAEVLAGDALVRLRRWAYGREDAPADFLCRKCVFALTA